jgi:hypothetical protein
LEDVDFFTMPIAPYAPDPNRVAIGPGAAQLWQQLRYDEELSELQLREGSSAETSSYDREALPGDAVMSALVAGEQPGLEGDQYGLCR